MLFINAIENDDDKAFMLNLYKEYYGLVRKTVYNIIPDNNYIEDLINDIFIKLIEKISLIRSLASCKRTAYIVYTSRSVAIDFLKRKGVRKKYTYYGKNEDLAEIIPSHENNEARIIHQEEIEELENAILSLPEKYKDLLYFKYVLEMNNAEIAKIISVAPDSVRQYLTRAKREAKKLMDNFIFFLKKLAFLFGNVIHY